MIRIFTKVHPGIYESQGGGKTHVKAEAKVAPRNLLRLAPMVREIARSAEAAYGNVGHIGTWMEINGQRVEPFELADLDAADRPDYPGGPAKTRAQKAADLIAYCSRGLMATEAGV